MARRGAALEEELFGCVTKSEAAIMDAGRRWSEEIGKYVPSDPKAVRKLIDDVFDLTESVLRSQREFAHSVLDSLEGTGKRTAAAAKKAASKRAKPAPRARKTTAA